MCGERHVAHANVKFFEFGSDHKHVEIEKLNRRTDKSGHYHFPKDMDFEELDFKTLKLTIRDQCGVHKKHIECNLPYHHYDIPLQDLFPKHETHPRQALLDLADPVWEPMVHCL